MGKSPQVRQRRLEQATASRMADTWFSLHRIGVDGENHLSDLLSCLCTHQFLTEPIYVSEVVALAMVNTHDIAPSRRCIVTNCVVESDLSLF